VISTSNSVLLAPKAFGAGRLRQESARRLPLGSVVGDHERWNHESGSCACRSFAQVYRRRSFIAETFSELD
jgi:hypothetical protein